MLTLEWMSDYHLSMTSLKTKLTVDRDITVHALLPDGRRVIRKDRASKWFVESLADGTQKPVNLDLAVFCAMTGKPLLNKPGGSIFDARVRAATKARRQFRSF